MHGNTRPRRLLGSSRSKHSTLQLREHPSSNLEVDQHHHIPLLSCLDSSLTSRTSQSSCRAATSRAWTLSGLTRLGRWTDAHLLRKSVRMRNVLARVHQASRVGASLQLVNRTMSRADRRRRQRLQLALQELDEHSIHACAQTSTTTTTASACLQLTLQHAAPFEQRSGRFEPWRNNEVP